MNPGIALARPTSSSERIGLRMNESVTRIKDVLAALIKAALVSDDEKSLGYRGSAKTAQQALAADPPDPSSVRVDGAWTFAIQEAEAPELVSDEGRVNLTLPRACLFTLDELVAPSFEVDAAVSRIRKSASTG